MNNPEFNQEFITKALEHAEECEMNARKYADMEKYALSCVCYAQALSWYRDAIDLLK